MSDQWVSPKRAAATIGVSERTVWRRIRDGEIESRLTGDGKREIRVESTTTPSDNIAESLSVLRENSAREIQVAGAAIDATRKLADVHQAELVRARRVGLVAWLFVAVLVVVVAGGGWYAVRSMTLTESDLSIEQTRSGHLVDRLTDAEHRRVVEEKRAAAIAADLSIARTDHRHLVDEQTKLQGALVKMKIDLIDATADATRAREAMSAAEVDLVHAQEAERRLSERVAELECHVTAEPTPTATTKPTTRPADDQLVPTIVP